MEIDTIEIFVKVVELGSFASAARLLKIPTTTVSSKIARLEKKFNVTFIQRSTRKLNITPVGRAYYERCLRALAELKAGEIEVESTTKEPSGFLRITAPYDFSNTILPNLIEKYIKKYSKVKVELIVTNRTVDLISEDIDLAFRAGELKNSELISRKFMSLTGGVYASPDYLNKVGKIKTIKDLQEKQFVIFKPTLGKKIALTDGSNKFEIELKGRIVTDELESARNLAERGLGVVLLPDFLCENSLVEGKLVNLFPNWTWSGGSKISIIYLSKGHMAPKIRAFLDLID